MAAFSCLSLFPGNLYAADLPAVVSKMRQSVVGIAIFLPFNGGSPSLTGSGFIVADGRHVITCAHVIKRIDEKITQIIYVLVDNGGRIDRRLATVIAQEPAYDIALLRIEGDPLPPAPIRTQPDLLPEGTDIATTGFPIGSVLGFFPVTHRGIVSARTSNFSPLPDSRLIEPKMVRAARFEIYQLDLIAYPGQSGSAFYDAQTGIVAGIINATFLRSTKEKVLSDPSAITYAIPSVFIIQILKANKLIF
jgi:S1-C subfamily serine protease